MEPHEYPAQPAGAEAAEGLEHWLRDLRSEATADPFDRSDEPPAPTRPAEVRGGGRHRAED